LAGEKEKQKEEDMATHAQCIADNAAHKVFKNPLSSYKTKEDLLSLGSALGIPTSGNAKEILAHIKDYVATASAATLPVPAILMSQEQFHMLNHPEFPSAPAGGSHYYFTLGPAIAGPSQPSHIPWAYSQLTPYPMYHQEHYNRLFEHAPLNSPAVFSEAYHYPGTHSN
jgi:hypothetical protein